MSYIVQVQEFVNLRLGQRRTSKPLGKLPLSMRRKGIMNVDFIGPYMSKLIILVNHLQDVASPRQGPGRGGMCDLPQSCEGNRRSWTSSGLLIDR